MLVTISVMFRNFFRRKICSYNYGSQGKRNLKIGCVCVCVCVCGEGGGDIEE